jgi:CubicO group peptidase (beta-lactamase class C family)
MQKLKVFAGLFLLFLALFYFADSRLKLEEAAPSVSYIKEINENPVLSAEDIKLRNSSEKFYEQSLLRSRFNGGILVSRNGKIIFEAYKGLNEVLKGDSINSSTSFHLASVSKTITAMAVLKLFEEKSISIDQPVASFLNGFPFPKITVRNLLSHRSGLPNYVHFAEHVGWDTKKTLTNQDILQLIIDKSALLDIGRPDAYFDYCNTNYALLALIVEKVSSLSFANYLDQTIFKPLGMNKSFVFGMEMADAVLPSFKFNNQREPFMFLDAVYGDKNIYSTPRDMMKWDMALYDTSFFSQKIIDEAFKGYSYERKGVKNYGLGWRLYEMPSGKKIVYHNGWWHGNNTVFSRLPQDTTVIIVLGNKFNRSIYQAKKIAGIFDGYGITTDDDE